MDTQAKEIENLINRMNDDWLNDRIENLDQYFLKQAVLIQPGTQKKLPDEMQSLAATVNS